MFSDKDLEQIKNKGLTLKNVQSQIEIFKKGLPFSNLKAAATIGDGVLKMSEIEENDSISFFEKNLNGTKVVKFVPASGAATRMFKFLFKFIDSYSIEDETINAYINKNKENDLSSFLIGLEKLPFFEEVIHKVHKFNPNFNNSSYDKQRFEFIKTMLDETRLNYSNYPKGLLPFHKYKKNVSTAFEEHLFEAALYASSNGNADLHFTISEKHNHKFDQEFKFIEEDVEDKTNTKFNISFSYQKEITDTIAVTSDNKPFKDENNRLVFRPSGHGALIENLNDLDADIIFIKNIDNVVVYKYKEEVAKYKKILAGILLKIQALAFSYLKEMEDEDMLTENKVIEIAEFLSKKIQVRISPEFEKYSLKYQIAYLKEKLNRPIRVCGMVKNEGEPGGGPFWVKDESGTVSLQIVESAQIDKKNKVQKDILKNATHFNPVDLVCGVKNYKGEKFDLTKFVDPKTAFITSKTKSGKAIKALELPGLWNGAMANWNTIFVEVPLITFNPVKTVNDLLKAPHQVK
ncbi:DUF4301 family protein [Pontimicrobium sp. IMCC45349]|uniref:DUF4301 family protein n=1 Tax=Pontimicrobium sp. IMCC45349 TaxID=3391574 RepID=UPI00399F65AE